MNRRSDPIPHELLKAVRNEEEFRKAMLNEWVPPPAERIIYIVARDLRIAHNYSGWYHHHIENNPNIIFRFVGREDDLRGRKDIEIHLVTTWQQNDRAWKIKEVVDHLVQSGRATVKEVEW